MTDWLWADKIGNRLRRTLKTAEDNFECQQIK